MLVAYRIEMLWQERPYRVIFLLAVHINVCARAYVGSYASAHLRAT